MKNQWLAYAIVAVISALAGVAIAGPPNMVGRDDTIVVPAGTSTTTVPATTTTVADETDDDNAGDSGVETDAAASETTVDAAADTTTTTTDDTTTTTTEPAPDRADIAVVAINGAGAGGLASRTRDALIDQGYELARATDGTDLVDDTVVYFFPFNERAAGVVAVDLGIDPFSIKPVDDAPDFGRQDGDQVAIYLGRDRG